jgi:predicted nucleic acid-binding protein
LQTVKKQSLAYCAAVELSARLNVYAYDAYVIACAMNQRAPILTLDRGLIERARDLKLDVLEVNVS